MGLVPTDLRFERHPSRRTRRSCPNDSCSMSGNSGGRDMIQTIETSSSEARFSEVQLLLEEFSHRINNELSSAISVISIAAARSATDEAKCVLSSVRDRLFNYAKVHHALQMPEYSTLIDGAAYLRQLCRAISRSKLDGKDLELLFTGRKFQMNSERCWRLGLIVSELITNAARHAFDDRGGVIRVELAASMSSIKCRVTDNGRGRRNIRPGNGMRIVVALASSIGGSIEQNFGPRGSTSLLICPAEVLRTTRRDQMKDLLAGRPNSDHDLTLISPKGTPFLLDRGPISGTSA